jgi:hypothetical protein
MGGGAFDFYLEVLGEPAASAEVRSTTPRRGRGRYCGRVVSSQDIAVSMYLSAESSQIGRNHNHLKSPASFSVGYSATRINALGRAANRRR